MKPTPSKAPIVLTVIAILTYAIVIGILYYCNILSIENSIIVFTTTLGWLIALLIAVINLVWAKRDNQKVKNYEIKKKLEITAIKEINEGIDNLSDKLSKASVLFLMLPGNLKLNITNPRLFRFDPIKITQEILMYRTELYRGSTSFILAIEANEIAVVEYDYFRKYISFKMEDLQKLIDDFVSLFPIGKLQLIKEPQGFSEFEKRCREINELGAIIQSYLSDYRIILMNDLLEEIFNKSVPHRKPLDDRYKLLTEVALKKDVEREENRRTLESIKSNHTKRKKA